MRVTLIPATSPRIESVDIIGEPTYGEKVPGGFTTADVSCVLPRGLSPLMLDARIKIQPTYGAPWIGRVDSIEEDNGVCALSCVGDQAMLDRLQPRMAIYCDSRVSEWNESTYRSRNANMSVSQEPAALLCTWSDGVAFTTSNGHQYAVYRLPEFVTTARVTCSYQRPNTVNYGFRVRTATTASASPLDGEDWGDLQDETAVGAGGSTTGTYTATCERTASEPFDIIIINFYTVANVTPSGDHYVTLRDLKVYATGSTGSATTVGGVIAHCVSRIPSWAGGNVSTFLYNDPTGIEPFVLDGAGNTEQDVIDAALQYTESDFGFWSRLVNGEWTSVPVLSARETTPAYYADVDGLTVDAEFAGDSIQGIATAVRVSHHDSNDRSTFTDATATTRNWLSTIAHERWATISADTSDATLAASIGTLAADAPAPVSGSASIHGPIRDTNGGLVQPTEITAGKVIRLHSPRGTLDARIITVKKSGDTSASIEFDNKPARLDAWLAKLSRLAQ